MAINRESNGYVIGFSIVMVVVVGTLLAGVAMALQPIQKANVRNEKMQNILQSTGMEISRDDAGKAFKDIVVKRVILDFYGNVVEGSEMSNSDPIESGNELCDVKGDTYYVAPVQGQGLWAAIWGYVSIKSDGTTVKGAVFDHKSETPGLGAEIAYKPFQNQFIDKQIAKNGAYTSISVIKPGPSLDEQTVDGISGGTFTSAGVDEMLKRTLVVYYNFLSKNNNYR